MFFRIYLTLTELMFQCVYYWHADFTFLFAAPSDIELVFAWRFQINN
jgi:hypothetical protein